MKSIPFINLFSQSAMGLSIHENDLIITFVYKKLIKYSHEKLKIKDFMIKNPQQLESSIILLKKFEGDVILYWPREHTIIREIDYPNANLKEFKEALGYQLDSFIPFTNEDVYFDIHALSQTQQGAKVLIVAVKKTELDAVLSKLHTLSIAPSRVIISPFAYLPVLGEKKGLVALISKNVKNYTYNLFENAHLVSSLVAKTENEVTDFIKTAPPGDVHVIGNNYGFLPEEYKTLSKVFDEYSESYGSALYGLLDYSCRLNLIKKVKKSLNPQMVFMGSLVGFIILFVFLIPYIQKMNNQAVLKQINVQIKKIKKDVTAVDKLQERIVVAEEAINTVNGIKEKYCPRIDVIMELAKILPNDAWIKSFAIEKNMFEIEGDAASSTNLIPILENSPLFSGVGLASPVTKTQTGREKFRIKGNIEK